MTKIDIAGYDEVHRLDVGGAVAFVALHAVLRGRAFGGIRIWRYPSEEAALADALALARAMSRKVVMAGIEGGGAKSVVMEPARDRAGAVRRLGEFIESLGGRYFCGGDLGFTEEDEAVLRRATHHVACPGLGEDTARTVVASMRAVCEPRTVAVQGVGAVGRPVARMLRDAGVRVMASDLRPFEGFEAIPAEAIYDVECDVFSPCATGGVLDAATIPRLRCRVVCGGANNPLASEEDAGRLRARGIAYVPDFLANCGATIRGASLAVGEGARIEERMAAVPGLVREVVKRARREGRTTHAVAVEMADERIAHLRG